MMYRFERYIHFCVTDKVKKTGIAVPVMVRTMTHHRIVGRHINMRRQSAEYIETNNDPAYRRIGCPACQFC